jgi:hypothetical protein
VRGEGGEGGSEVPSHSYISFLGPVALTRFGQACHTTNLLSEEGRNLPFSTNFLVSPFFILFCSGFALSSLSVHSRFTLGSLSVHSRFTLGSLSVHSRFTLGSLSVHSRFTLGSLSLTARSQSLVSFLFRSVLSFLSSLPLYRAPSVCNIFKRCALGRTLQEERPYLQILS